MNYRISYLYLLALLTSPGAMQACESTLTFRLQNSNGGCYKEVNVTLTDYSDGKTYEAKSNDNGEATFKLPCERRFKLMISNYGLSSDVNSPPDRSKAVKTLSYAPDYKQKTEKLKMSETEKSTLDKQISELPDSVELKTAISYQAKCPKCFTRVNLRLTDFNKAPLSNERFFFSGKVRGKSFFSTTGSDGSALIYLPKGDVYVLNFIYTSQFAELDIEPLNGNASIQIFYSYIGTKEILKRKKEEADRIAAEEKRLLSEKIEFEAWCKKLGISTEEGMRRKLKESLESDDTVVLAVLNRNNWKDKLVVCDLTGSMSPYALQLSLWYQLVHKSERNLQFVFFNDGDNQPDHMKKIGETGGIYYTPSKGIDSLAQFMARVSSRGYGGDCPENNMEALIKGVKMAGPFKEIVMIADNHAPVKDIMLLKDFNVPVHIILCGANGNDLHVDYLNIARKTGGSIHTMEEDILNLASFSEGEEVVIMQRVYRVMGGKFIRVNKT